MEVIYIIITSIFTLGGTLGGVALGHFLNSHQQKEARKLEYSKESLRNIQCVIGKMEVLTQNILILLVTSRLLPSEEQLSTIKENVSKKIKQISDYIMNNPVSFSINESLDDALSEVFTNFSNLCLTLGLNMSNSLGEQLPADFDVDLVKKLLRAASDNDYDSFFDLIAQDDKNQIVLDVIKTFAQSIGKLRKEVKIVLT